ncbi:hypothetical protein MAQ5080_02639 [Marinomonas aquimarina]|uniref:Uncharacterized protein n=1 Tax=Marinomonas aquimarina TaxID=295068 RepID=A0A1A8TKZ2_9GAMM|nr:hypothetical protein [Marinomonas aquimarina]SBS33656.1 hypothetical protein MAQ5080_02639 [Marinomonas aquimarina]
MIRLRPVFKVAIPCLMLLSYGPAMASDAPRYQNQLQDIIEQVVVEVVEVKIRDVHDDIRIRIGSDDRYYDQRQDYRYNDEYRHRHERLSYESRRALKRLGAQHDRAMRRLESELVHKLREAEHDFRYDTRRARHGKKIAHQRNKLSKKVDKAYRQFDRKMAKEVDRFEEQRHQILSSRWGA